MAGKKLYTGVVLEDDSLKIARISVSGKKASLVMVDKIKLIEPLEKAGSSSESEEVFDAFDEDLEDDSIFGIEEDDIEAGDLDLDLNLDSDTDSDELDDDLGLDLDLDDFEGEEDLVDMDMADENNVAAPASNELLLYNLLSSIDPKKVRVGLNIPSGSTIFQILKDVDFSSTKKKDLNIIVDDRLESLYGSPKGEDFYSYSVRNDGALLLASIDDEPQALQLINRTQSLYRGKLFIDEVLPDEALIIGLIRANYEFDPDTITAAIQYGEASCRVLFMRGDQLWIVSPVITEGTRSRKFLNTVFSKILFQLDTGEVPNLDKIILCNNSLGDEAVEFFQDRFPDIEVSEFAFNESVFETEDFDPSTVASFTTAIGMAWASAGFERDKFPKISFLPNYVKDRQKIFKLQWHGFVLLGLILSVFPITNYYYLANDAEINRLQDEINDAKLEVLSMQSTVNEYNRISSDLSAIQSRLELLDALSSGTLTWSTNLDIVNRGIDNIDSIWITLMAQDQRTGVIDVQGYSLYRNRIPMIADIFDNAVLLDVSRATIREKDVYSFQYQVSSFVPNTEIYTPESAKGLKEVLGN